MLSQTESQLPRATQNALRNESQPTAIGRCRFSQLPTEYQRKFEQGANHDPESFFVAEKYPWSSLILMPFYLLVAAGPMGLVFEVPQIPVMPWVLPGIAVFGAAVWLSARCLVAIIGSIRAARAGRRTYGLLLDDHNLVVRRLELWKFKNCVFLPRSEIDEFRMSYEIHAGSGSRAERTFLVNAHRQRPDGKDHRICISYGDWLEMKPTELHQALKDRWSAASNDASAEDTPTQGS